MNLIKFLIAGSLMTIPFMALATDCSKPVTAMKEGDKTQCDGFLFSRHEEIVVRRERQQLKIFREENQIQNEIVSDYKREIDNANQAFKDSQQKADMWEKQADKYTKKYEEVESSKTAEDTLWFVGGVAIGLVTGGGLVWFGVHVGTALVPAISGGL